jgi:hypothetical protein
MGHPKTPSTAELLTDNTPKKCSQCKVNDLDTTGLPLWCKECRARYQRERNVLRTELTEAQGFAAGVEAMRKTIVEAFSKVPPNGMMMAGEIAAYVAGVPAPKHSID